jgi:hypothetical protein
MIVSTINQQFGTMWSETNNIGWWADKDVSFNIPVKIFKKNNNGNLELVSLALVCPFAYGNTGRAVITDREINGRPTLRADIKSPPDAWLSPQGPSACRSLLELKTEVFPAINMGQKGEMRTLIEMDEKDPVMDDTDGVRWRSIRDTWGIGFFDELERLSKESARITEDDTVVALAVEILAQRQPLNIIYLKQFRDAEVPEEACYQAYIKATKEIFGIINVQEISRPQLNIRIYKYPSHPIVETLGLVCKAMDSADGVTHVFQPIGPFCIRLRVNEALSQELWWRSSIDDWQSEHPWFSEEQNRSAVPIYETPYFESSTSTPKRRGSIGPAAHRSFLKRKQPWAELKKHVDQWLLVELKKDLDTLESEVNQLRSLRQELSDKAERKKKIKDLLLPYLAKNTVELLDAFHWEFELVKRSERPGSLFNVVEDLAAAIGKLTKRDVLCGSTRLSTEQARAIIEQVDDVQVVIQYILRKWKDSEE